MNYTSTAAAAAAAATTLVQFSSAQSVYWERDFRSKKSIVSDVPLFCFFCILCIFLCVPVSFDNTNNVLWYSIL